MRSQSTIVFYKDGDKNIYLFEANDIDAIFRGFKEDAFKDKENRAYFLVNGIEIKLTE
ncbi:hypothetical protein Si082_01999 [Streptococcus infantarius subsp. infantarius]|nr:hypothetical protein [Streptococcus infantarius subsp. infantarius]